ncbi:uncharacterized protein TNCV_705861 [Trichonephila clavipes]|nr:uncharacterized protein TNCV_705861 [Trichonephila clavipes]
MKEVAEESMKRAAVEENSSSPDNLLTVSGDGTWKTRGHSSLIGVCTVIGAETGKVLDREVSSFCKGCDSYKGVKFGIKYNKWQRAHKISRRKNYSGSAGKMEVDGMLRIFNRSEKLHNLKYSNYIGDGDTKTFNALSENKPYGDDHLIQKIECVGHEQKRMGARLRKLKLVYSKKKLSDGKTIGGKGRLTDSLIDKLAHYYGNAIRCNSTSVKEMRKAIWAVWDLSCSTDDAPMHWFCPTNPNTWCKYNAAINNNLQNYKHKPSVAKVVRDVIKPVFADLSHPALLKKCLGEKFGLKINRNVCVSLAERDNRRIFTSRQRRLESSFEARRAKKIKKSKEIELFQEQEEVRNPQTTSNLLQIIDKYEERFLNRKIRCSSWESRDIQPNENNRFPNRNRQENWRETRGNNRYADNSRPRREFNRFESQGVVDNQRFDGRRRGSQSDHRFHNQGGRQGGSRNSTFRGQNDRNRYLNF